LTRSATSQRSPYLRVIRRSITVCGSILRRANTTGALPPTAIERLRSLSRDRAQELGMHKYERRSVYPYRNPYRIAR
jgi:hypothetical protein